MHKRHIDALIHKDTAHNIYKCFLILNSGFAFHSRLHDIQKLIRQFILSCRPVIINTPKHIPEIIHRHSFEMLLERREVHQPLKRLYNIIKASALISGCVKCNQRDQISKLAHLPVIRHIFAHIRNNLSL